MGAALDAQKFATWRGELESYLESNGLKHSEQRWLIAKCILESRRHLTAQEIVKQVLHKHPDIGSATVYRNIKLLCQARILKETLVDAEGSAIYETFDDEHHDHIVCLDCNEIVEFSDSSIESRQENILKDMKFDSVRHRHILYARCQYKSV